MSLRNVCLVLGTYMIHMNDQTNFLNTSKSNGAMLSRLVIDDDDLAINIATFPGREESLLMHISGTHGIEGYVGSEIQQNIINNYVHDDYGPTVIFVHGLNPFGMKYLRRVNENNVDLNRNALFSNDEWYEALTRRDTYGTVSNTINHNYEYEEGFFSKLRYLFDMAKIIMSHGYVNAKRSMVTGTYNNAYSECLFYGGSRLEKSHHLLKTYLEDMGYTDSVTNLAIIDVHSGQGEYGKDTVMISSTNTYFKSELEDVFNESDKVSYTHDNNSSNGSRGLDMTEGYELTMGDVADNYPKLFPNREKVLSITQEFGTYHGILVTLGLIEENHAWHYGNRSSRNDDLYRLFSPLDDKKFKKEVIGRGSLVFEKSLKQIK